MNANEFKLLVLSSAVTAALSWAIPKALDHFVPALQNNIFATHPLETVMLAVISSTIGFLFGWKAKEWFYSIGKSNSKSRKAEEFEKARRAFCELDPDTKAIMLAALDKGAAYCDGDDWRFSRLPENPFIAQFVETSYIDGDVAKITALPLLEQFREAAPDSFLGLSSTLEQHARNRGERTYSMFSTSLNWWWYR